MTLKTTEFHGIPESRVDIFVEFYLVEKLAQQQRCQLRLGKKNTQVSQSSVYSTGATKNHFPKLLLHLTNKLDGTHDQAQ